MKRIWWIIGIFVVLVTVGVIVYRRQAAAKAAAATSIQTASVTQGTLTASLNSAGNVRPGQSAVITWQTSGQVGNITVKLGDQVKANQELTALDPNTLSPSVINAKQNLIDAQKNLDDVMNSTLQQAQALQAVNDAQKNLDDLNQTSAEDLAQAQLTLAIAQKAADDAQKKRTYMNYPHSTDDLVIQNAETNYLLAKGQYKDALQAFNKVAHKKLTSPDRAAALKALVAAQQKMDQALATYNWYLLKPTDNEIAQADANLAVAQANLTKAQNDVTSLSNGPDASALALAEAQLADAQRQWERVKDGPNPDDIAAAQAAVDAAQATINQTSLFAPFNGTITEVDINPGDVVNSGKQAFQIDDLSSIYVDLQVAEVDINTVKVGQKTALTFDAIPNKQYEGEVTEIGGVGSVSQGVVNYPVTVKIDNPDADVKPGMTAAVTITVAQHDNVMMVPNQAVRVAGNQRTVTVLFEGQQIRVPVTVGLTNETMSEVSSDQLRAGDEVVINSQSSSSGQQQGGGFGGPGFGGPGFFR